MRARAAGRELVALWRVSGRAAAAYGGGRLRAARRARQVRVEGAWRYEEALVEGLLDPALRPDTRRRYVSQHAREAAQGRLGPPALDSLTEEKLTFHRYCDALSIPGPALHGVVGRAGCWSASTGRVAAGPGAFGRMVREELPPSFVVKPVDGYLGRSVYAVAREGDRLRVADGRLLDIGRFHAELVADPEFELFLLQERLRNHPDLDALHPSGSLQTLRLTTMIERDGSVELIAAWLKLTLAGAASDNYSDGAGNGKVLIDVDTGRMEHLVVPRPDGIGSAEVPIVPSTGRAVRGAATPLFAEARRLVLDAAPHFLPLRTLGWDVGLTPDGPKLVETNNYWGHAGLPMSPDAMERLTNPDRDAPPR